MYKVSNNKNIIHSSRRNENLIPESFEIGTKKFFTLIKEQNIRNGKQLNDLKVYSKIISKILTLPIKIIDDDFYISLKEVQNICEEEFQHLSKNWKEK